MIDPALVDVLYTLGMGIGAVMIRELRGITSCQSAQGDLLLKLADQHDSIELSDKQREKVKNDGKNK